MTNGLRVMVVETTARRGGLALAAGPQVLATRLLASERDIAGDLLPAADELCRQVGWRPAELQVLLVSVGPGSFTGARIGVTFAKTLAMAAHAKVVAVPTLLAVAQNALALPEPPAHVTIVIDAKRKQVYGETYRLAGDGSRYELLQPGRLLAMSDLLEAIPRPAGLIGQDIEPHREAIEAAGLHVLPEDLANPRVETVHALGWEMAERGEFAEVDALVPHYFRLPTPVERLQSKPQ